MKKKHTAVPGAKGAAPGLGLRWQLTLFLCGITLLTLTLLWGLITWWLEPMYNRNIRDGLEDRTEAIVNLINASDVPIATRSFGVVSINQDFVSRLTDLISDGNVPFENYCVDISDSTCTNLLLWENIYPCALHQSVSDWGGVVKVNENSAAAIRLRMALISGDETSSCNVLRSGGVDQMVVGGKSADGQFVVLVSTSLAPLTTAAKVLASVLLPIALLLFFLNVVAAVLFSRWFTRPIRSLSAGAREIAGGNYDVQIDDVWRKDEFGLLAREFNHMAGEVKYSAQLQKDLLANVSHDLRTPLTLIKGYAETVRDITGTDEARRTEQCNIIVDETDRLSALVNSVMELSKVSSGAEKPNLVDFDMSELCFEVAGRYDAVCDQNGWTLKLEADRACPVQADPAMMERVLHNLLGNATHHIGADGVFILRAIPLAGGGCRVEVEDHGPGIPPEDLPHLFDRYYRSRSDAGKTGTGLGLSITKAILQQHGFAFGVNSTVGRGSTFWFEMRDTRPQPALTQ